MNKELQANTTLSHYRIVSRLGAGGMGEVYLAQDTRLDLEDAYRQRDWSMSALLKKEPMIESLRDDARYKDLLKRLNLAE